MAVKHKRAMYVNEAWGGLHYKCCVLISHGLTFLPSVHDNMYIVKHGQEQIMDK
jgi:hypothetical protein